jgi:hypothetical protein
MRGVDLTLEGPKPRFRARTSLEKLDEAIRRSAEGGWLKMLGTKAGLEDLIHVKSWEGLKQWVADHWGSVVDVAVKRLGEEVRSELEALRNKLNDDKIAREVVAPALLLIQAEKLGVNEETLRYFAAVVSGAIDGDGHVSAALKKVALASGERGIALLWGAALATYGIETEVRDADRKFDVVASGVGAARLARLYFLYGAPLLEGDERIINHKLAEAALNGRRRRRFDHFGGRHSRQVQCISARQGRARIPINGPEPRGARGPLAKACGRQRRGEEGGR